MRRHRSTWLTRLVLTDRAATDPILVIAAIAVSLVLLVGGSFAVTGFIDRSKDLNAQKDLAAVRVIEADAANSGGFINYDSLSSPPPGVAYDATEGSKVRATACTDGWVAASTSPTGKTFVSTSASTATEEAPAATIKLPSCATRATVTDLVNTVPTLRQVFPTPITVDDFNRVVDQKDGPAGTPGPTAVRIGLDAGMRDPARWAPMTPGKQQTWVIAGWFLAPPEVPDSGAMNLGVRWGNRYTNDGVENMYYYAGQAWPDKYRTWTYLRHEITFTPDSTAGPHITTNISPTSGTPWWASNLTFTQIR
ncbi:hypothetical protein [Curtobacterium sp. MCSS17_016]|uniref:hypothetical protein n=1 Tax=Curtobacterium sp. MCSS17_016 TaxID=2175644 RepID=UPI000DA87A63|nr:hypothetical protein [Curtobacterium sp. MCSS17_016]WIE81232.1 hypothetical protein DEJ19_018535 [Curtobacterium sp. MCSS17_016]